MTSRGDFVELQGTAEGKPFNKETVDSLLSMAGKGIGELFKIQQAVLEATGKK
jgi:ribonuclease PH